MRPLEPVGGSRLPWKSLIASNWTLTVAFPFAVAPSLRVSASSAASAAAAANNAARTIMRLMRPPGRLLGLRAFRTTPSRGGWSRTVPRERRGPGSLPALALLRLTSLPRLRQDGARDAVHGRRRHRVVRRQPQVRDERVEVDHPADRGRSLLEHREPIPAV